MEKVSLRRKHCVLVAAALAVMGWSVSSAPAAAQERSTTWRAPMATITVTAAPLKNLREIQRLTVEGHKFLVVSASIPVPYGDLNLAQETGANELGRRIRVAARMACQQLDSRYPPHIYAVIGSDDCVRDAAGDGMAEAGQAIAAARK